MARAISPFTFTSCARTRSVEPVSVSRFSITRIEVDRHGRALLKRDVDETSIVVERANVLLDAITAAHVEDETSTPLPAVSLLMSLAKSCVR